MPKAKDLTGQKFGLLTAIKKMPSHSGHTYWLCRCECGNEKEVQTSHLTCGKIQSCGCQQKSGNANVNQNFQPKEQNVLFVKKFLQINNQLDIIAMIVFLKVYLPKSDNKLSSTPLNII